MILVCKDFSYDGQALSTYKLASVNFDDDTTLPSSIERELEETSMNKYRSEKSIFGATYTNALEFELHITKDFDEFTSQSELEFAKQEYEDIIAWLTSPNQYLLTEITKEDGSVVLVKGIFSSVIPFDVSGICYGFKCTFKCNSPFSYVRKKVIQTISGVKNISIQNDSSEHYDYVYPYLTIAPTANEDIFIHNISDSKQLETGRITVNTDKDKTLISLMDKVDAYGLNNRVKIEYVYDGAFIKSICDKTALLFYATDVYGTRNKGIAYYLDDGQYFICQGGFFYCSTLKALNLTMDCKTYSFYDEINRPVLFNRIGIQDEDEIYWLRFIYGNNNLRIRGHITLNIEFLEPRKGELI